MDYVHYDDIPVQMAVDLVNTLDGATGHDELTSTEALTDFLNAYKTDWAAEDWFEGEPSDADLETVLKSRACLRSVFEADDEQTAADLLNGLLADVSAVPRVSMHNGSSHLHFEPSRGTFAQWLGATTAMGLVVVLCDHGLTRFGICSAQTCNDAFVDTSKNRSRRNCSSVCTTRHNVAAHRRRKADTNTAD